MIKKNQSGISLIEVLASIVLLVLIGFLAWNIFFQGANYSKNAMTKNQMYQEANLIMIELTKNHQNVPKYVINSIDSCSFQISKIEDTGQTDIIEKSHSKLCYSIENLPITVDSNTNSIKFNLLISDRSKLDNKIRVTIPLHRLVGG